MSDDLRTVATFASAAEAAIARNALEAAGVRAAVNDEYTLIADPLLGGAVNFIKVQVREDDLERAAEVLADVGLPADDELAADATAEPPNAEDELAADGGSDDYAPELPGERLVNYAFRASVMGLLACPPVLHLYSLAVLMRVALLHSELPPAANRRFYVAFLLDLAVLTTAALLALEVFRR